MTKEHLKKILKELQTFSDKELKYSDQRIKTMLKTEDKDGKGIDHYMGRRVVCAKLNGFIKKLKREEDIL